VDRAVQAQALHLVGLARRAGRAVVGTQAVRDALNRGEVRVVMLADDAAPNAQRRISGLAHRARVPVVCCGSRETLGRAVGREGSVVVGVTDGGLANRIAGLRRSG